MTQVTDREFFAAIATALVLRRKEKGIKSPNAIAGLGGPTQKTVEQIERGHIGRVDKLAQYAKAVELTLVDLFRSVLSSGERHYSPEVEEIIRLYERATTKGRVAIYAVAVAVPTRELATGMPDGPTDQPQETLREAPTTAKRRVQR